MPSLYKDGNGDDLDDVFELAPTEAKSVFANLVGSPVIGIDEPGNVSDPGFWIVKSIASGQYKTSGIELTKRYLHNSLGSAVSAAGIAGKGYKIRVYVEYIANVDGTPTVLAGPNYYNIELSTEAAAIGTAATVPTYADYDSSQNANSVITDAMNGTPVFEETASYSMLANMPAISSIAITGYTLVGVSWTALTSNTSYTDPVITGSSVDSSGQYTGDIEFTVYGGLSGTETYEVAITSKATNSVGDSLVKTHTFVISVSYNASGGGGDGPGPGGP